MPGFVGRLLAMVAQAATGTAAGGNARGANAVDWQTVRGAAAQVASGTQAVVGGGQQNTAAGTRGVVAGGNSNSAGGGEAFVGGGIANSAGGAGAAVAGGTDNNANGQASWAPGGKSFHARGLFGRGGFGSGHFAAVGDAQAGEMVLRAATTDATPTALTSDGAAAGASDQFILANTSVAMLRVQVAARASDGSGKHALVCDVQVRRDANAASTLVLAGTPVVLSSGTVTGWAVAFTADTTNGGLRIEVTGAAATAIKWVGRVSGVEMVG